MIVAIAMTARVIVIVAVGMRVHAPQVAAFRAAVNSCVIGLQVVGQALPNSRPGLDAQMHAKKHACSREDARASVCPDFRFPACPKRRGVA